MTLFISNRDGNGQTNEEGHYRFQTQVWDGNVIGDGLKVRENSPLGLSVLISKGDFKVDRTDGYSYTGWNNDNNLQATIGTADGSNPRIDAVVIYVDLAEATAASPPNNPGIAKILVVAGTPAGSPSAPSDATIQTAVGAGNPFIRLANVRVNASATQITNANITDTRTVIFNSSLLKSSVSSGWIPVIETHTRVTNNQTTVPGDLTAKYRKGTKVKGTNGTVKYRVVASSSHSGGTTTINYIPTTDYVWASGAISDVSVSYIENPEGWPVEFNWMPTFTNFTLGNGTINRAIYIPAVKSIFFEILVTLGSTSSVSGPIRFTLPADVAATGRDVQAFYASALKPGTINSSMSGVFFSATQGEIRPLVSNSTYLHFASDTTSTVPFTWASGDSWHARGTYRMA